MVFTHLDQVEQIRMDSKRSFACRVIKTARKMGIKTVAVCVTSISMIVPIRRTVAFFCSIFSTTFRITVSFCCGIPRKDRAFQLRQFFQRNRVFVDF